MHVPENEGDQNCQMIDVIFANPGVWGFGVLVYLCESCYIVWHMSRIWLKRSHVIPTRPQHWVLLRGQAMSLNQGHKLPACWGAQQHRKHQCTCCQICQVQHNCPSCNDQPKLPHATLVQVYSTNWDNTQHFVNITSRWHTAGTRGIIWQKICLEQDINGTNWYQNTCLFFTQS